MNDFKSDFVDNMVFYRTQKGLSQLELSGICDCGKSTISGIKIAYALEVHPADLFLRNASSAIKDVRDFFEKDVMQLLDSRFPKLKAEE